jgi:hypothetical protein
MGGYKIMEIYNYIPLLIWSLIIAMPWQNYETEEEGKAFAKIYGFGLFFWFAIAVLCNTF